MALVSPAPPCSASTLFWRRESGNRPQVGDLIARWAKQHPFVDGGTPTFLTTKEIARHFHDWRSDHVDGEFARLSTAGMRAELVALHTEQLHRGDVFGLEMAERATGHGYRITVWNFAPAFFKPRPGGDGPSYEREVRDGRGGGVGAGVESPRVVVLGVPRSLYSFGACL